MLNNQTGNMEKNQAATRLQQSTAANNALLDTQIGTNERNRGHLAMGEESELINLKKSTAKGRDRKLAIPMTNSANAIPLQPIGTGRGKWQANSRIPAFRRKEVNLSPLLFNHYYRSGHLSRFQRAICPDFGTTTTKARVVEPGQNVPRAKKYLRPAGLEPKTYCLVHGFLDNSTK